LHGNKKVLTRWGNLSLAFQMNYKAGVHFKEKNTFPFEILSLTINKAKEDACSTFPYYFFHGPTHSVTIKQAFF
jgi:hypothetical protein